MGIHRGDAFEEVINWSNQGYRIQNKAKVVKVPVPVKVLKRIKNMITKAFFEEKAFLDYVGIAKGIAVAFDAKETEEVDRFPLKNVKQHQIDSIREWTTQGGQAFLLVNFKMINKTYRLDATTLLWYWDQYQMNKGKRGYAYIPLREFECNCKLIKSRNGIALDYLEGIA